MDGSAGKHWRAGRARLLFLERLEDRRLLTGLINLGGSVSSGDNSGDLSISFRTGVVRFDVSASTGDRDIASFDLSPVNGNVKTSNFDLRGSSPTFNHPAQTVGVPDDADSSSELTVKGHVQSTSDAADPREYSAIRSAVVDVTRRDRDSSYQASDNDDGLSDARKQVNQVNADDERDPRPAGRREASAGEVAENSQVEGLSDSPELNFRNESASPVGNSPLPGNVNQLNDKVAIAQAAAAERLVQFIALCAAPDDEASSAAPSAAIIDPPASVPAQAQIRPEPTTETAPSPTVSLNSSPAVGWFPIDLTKLERGVSGLLTHLDLLGKYDPKELAFARYAVYVAGAWAAYEIVRPRERSLQSGLVPAGAVLESRGGEL